MSRRVIAVFLTILIALTTPNMARAQQPPDAIYPALAKLSDHLGITITLESLDSWSWTRQNYPDTSLGCPQPGQVYAQGLTNGYQFTLIYQQVVYDLRVSTSGSTAILCQPDSPTLTPESLSSPTPVVLPSPTRQPDYPRQPLCPDAPPSPLAAGMEARVAPGTATGNIRAAPDSNGTIIGQARSGDVVAILDGPLCAGQRVWWQINYATLVGWMAETDGDVVVLQPVDFPVETPSAPSPTLPATIAQPTILYDLPLDREVITATNGARLSALEALTVPDAIRALAWSPDGATLAAGGESGIWLVDTISFSTSPRLLQVRDAPVHALAFSPGESLLASAHADATVRLWDVSTGGQLAVLPGHGVPINALAFSADGANLAAGSGGDTVDGNVIDIWAVDSRTRITTLSAHTRPVTGLVFSPDGTLLASASEDQTVRLWDMISSTLATVLQGHDAPVNAVAFAPDGRWLTALADNGSIHLWDVLTSEQRLLATDSAAGHALVFLPQSTLFASAAGDNVRLWDLEGLQELVRTSPGETPQTITALATSPDGTVLVTATTIEGTDSSTIQLYGVLPQQTDTTLPE